MEACLSVVIPVYNELGTIDEVLARVLAQPMTREVIVVDDCSTDGTRDRLMQLADPRVVVLYQPFNQGKGAALRRGFTAATSSFVVVQDADLEYDPADFPVLLGPLLDGRADVVFGSRFLTGGAHRVLYYWHSVGNRLLTTASNVATNLNLTDMETCYKVFRREVIQSIDIREDRFGFEPEVTAKVAAGGWRVYEVGVSYHGRTYAEGKKIGWRDGVRALYCIARYSKPGSAVRARLEAPPGAPPALPAGDDPDRAEWLASLVEPWLGDRVVLLGGGPALADRLARSGDPSSPVTVLDRSEAGRRVLQERFAGRADVRVADGPADCFGPRRPVDTVVLAGFLEHEADPAILLRTLRAALAPGGRIVALVPGAPAVRRVAGRPGGRVFDRASLRRVLSAADLCPEVLRPVNVSMPIPRPGPRAGRAGVVGARGEGVVDAVAAARRAAAGVDRAVLPLLRVVEERVELPVGRSWFCVATAATVPGRARPGSDDGEIEVVL